MNRLLSRQLRRLGLTRAEPPTEAEAWQALLDRVSAVYEESARSRYLLERAMEISSREMREMARELEDHSLRRAERSEQHYRHLFSRLPVAAWEEDFQRVEERLQELRRQGVEDLDSWFDGHPEELDNCISLVEILDVNAAVVDLLGDTDRTALLGSVDPAGLSEPTLASWRREFLAIWDGEGRVEFEFVGQRLDGTEFAGQLHWTAVPIDGAYDYSRVMVVVIDISDRVAAEDQMRQLMEAKDEFLATVSHELRTPLTSVLGYTEVLRDGTVDEPERKSMLDTIAEQAADLSDIVEDLLVGARSQIGEVIVDTETISIDEVVESVLGDFPEVQRSGTPQGPVVALADGGRVRQVLRNLLTNARRYGGSRVLVQIEQRDSEARIAVCDDGPPLLPVVTEHMFERYYRDRQQGGRPGSVGIGLTISRDLARRMGGDLEYRHDGKWGRFELILPAPAPPLRATA